MGCFAEAFIRFGKVIELWTIWKRQTVVLQQTNKCSMSTIEALKKGMKYVQS